MHAVRTIVASLAVTATLLGCASPGVAPRPQLLSVVVIRASETPAGELRAGSAGCISGTGAAVAETAHAVSTERNALFEPRWRDDAARAVRVHIENATTLGEWSLAERHEVTSAMYAWELAGAPVHFVVVQDDERADVRVHWIEKFDSRYEGWTTVSWNHDGWLVGADVELALRSPAGARLTPGERQQVVTHEFGHVLGLSHSGSTTSIMSQVVKVSGIAKVDAAALQALYSDRGGPDRAAADTESCSNTGL